MLKRNPIISFEDVTFAYEGAESFALDGVTLDVREGEFVCVLGGNGSGKTTLAKMVNGLLVPRAGSVITCGLDTSNASNLYQIRQYAGMVFQNPDDQMVGNFIEDDVAFGPENLCLPSAEIQVRVEESLKQVGLRSFAKHETQALSGGQKQRVAIAGALAMRPRILILDEAGSMLDPRGRADLLKACRKLNDEGLTILLVTHFLNEAAYADRVVIMQDGKIAKVGSAEEILEDQQLLTSLNLDVSYAVEVSTALQNRGIPIKTCMFDTDLATEIRDWNRGQAPVPFGTGDRHPFHLEQGTGTCSNGTCSNLIEVRDVSYSYLDKRALKARTSKSTGSVKKPKWGSDPEAVWALRDLSFTVYEGDFLGIIGHTGSGKSTLLKMLAGLDRPTRGEVLLDGLSLATKQGINAARESVGIVMQYPEWQLFAQTVFEDCAFGPQNLGLDEQEVERRVKSALRLVGLEDESIFRKSPFQLSGGQQRRVAIAGVLAMHPKVLILDEPTAGLDAQGSKQLLALIAKMHDEHGITIIIVSHNMNTIAHFCNRILVLNKGQELAQGSPIEVFEMNEALHEVGLGLPWTLDFANRLGIKGFNNVPNIEQLTDIIYNALSRKNKAADWNREQAPVLELEQVPVPCSKNEEASNE